MQDEVTEVILIKDCSADNALAICKHFNDKQEKVKLYQHHDKKNSVASSSRNLWIIKA